MFKRLVVSSALCASLLSLTPVFAQEVTTTVEYEAAGIELTVPAGWECHEEDGILYLGPEDGDLQFLLYEVDAESIEEALDELDEAMAEVVEFDEIEDAEEHEINGLHVVTCDATGTLCEDGSPVECGVAVLVSPNDHVVVLFGIASPEAAEEYGEEIVELFASLCPSE